jgi:hypothetical protein
MNEHSEQSSIEILENNNQAFAVGGLILAMCIAMPLFLVVAIAQAASLFAEEQAH